MKPISDKDKPKLFALIGLSVCVLGYGVYALTTGLAGATPPPAPPAKQVDAHKPAAGAPGAVEGAPEALNLASLSTVPNQMGGRDPFIPQFAPPAPAPEPTKVASVPLPDLNKLSGPRFGLNLPKTDGAPGAANPEVVKLPDPPPPSVSVAGVLVAAATGTGRDIAILRGANAEKRYVAVGDPVGNGFVIAAVRLDGVEIVDERKAERRVTIPVSGK